MRRIVTPELLDDDLGTPEEVAASLADLRHINRSYGGIQTTLRMLRDVAAECNLSRLSLLEVGSGAGDVPLTAQRSLASEGMELEVMLLDRKWTHLPADGTRSVAGDALQLPFRDNVFDVVSCSLFAHHFDPGPLRRMAGEALRVCRHAVLINDLIRSRLHLWLVLAALPTFRSRITRHDAPASVRNAYNVAEMRQVLAGLSAGRINISRHRLYRMGAVLWKQQAD
jgi:ubiquinone/menaquinone biosynthesis C-methylase UbiE